MNEEIRMSKEYLEHSIKVFVGGKEVILTEKQRAQLVHALLHFVLFPDEKEPAA